MIKGKSRGHFNTWTGKFLIQTPVAQAIGPSGDRWDIMELNSFCIAKETVTKGKDIPHNGREILASCTCDRGLLPEMYKEPKKLNRKSHNLIKNE